MPFHMPLANKTTLYRRSKTNKVSLNAILLGVGASIYTSNTLHANSVHYAHKLTTTRHAVEKLNCSQGLSLEQGAARSPLVFFSVALQHWPNVLFFSLFDALHLPGRECLAASIPLLFSLSF